MSFLEFLENRSKLFIAICGTALTALLGIADYLTGFELSFAVFYLIPVALVAWFGGRRAGIIISIASTITWQGANRLAGEQLSNPLVPYWNASTRLVFFLVVVFLITRLKKSLGLETELARTDFLTGAANPRAFYEPAEMEINRSRRYGHTFTVAYFDADNFKTVNDQLGHPVGSQMLIRVVEIVKQNLRVTDVVARIGGDEFAVLLPETGVEQSSAVVHKLQERLRSEMRSNGWPLTFSIGVLTCADPPHTVDEIIKLADDLMYEVKKDGKDAIRHEVLKAELVTERVRQI